MKNLDELIVELRQVYDDLNELKESNKEKKIDDIDFNSIKNKAKTIPLKNEILKNSSEYVQKSYLKLLASILHFKNLEDVRKSQMLYIARIVEGIDNKNITLENVYSSSIDMSIGEMNEAITQISKDMADLFIVDMMICANIKGRAKDEILEYISNIFSLMNVKLDVMKELIYLANSILLLDRDRILDTKPIVDLNRFNYVMNDVVNEKIFYKLEDIKETETGDLILLKSNIMHMKEAIDFTDYKFKSIKFVECNFYEIHSIYCLNKSLKFINCIFENIRESYYDEETSYRKENPADFMCISNVSLFNCKFMNCATSGYLLNLSRCVLRDCEFINCSSNSNNSDNKYRGSNLIYIDKGMIFDNKFDLCYIYRKGKGGLFGSDNYAALIYISDAKVNNIDLYRCESYMDATEDFANIYSYIVDLNNSSIENSIFEECEAKTGNVNYGRYYTDIINFNESLGIGNKFINCYCEEQE